MCQKNLGGQNLTLKSYLIANWTFDSASSKTNAFNHIKCIGSYYHFVLLYLLLQVSSYSLIIEKKIKIMSRTLACLFLLSVCVDKSNSHFFTVWNTGETGDIDPISLVSHHNQRVFSLYASSIWLEIAFIALICPSCDSSPYLE